jgi:hypothetical protein
VVGDGVRCGCMHAFVNVSPLSGHARMLRCMSGKLSRQCMLLLYVYMRTPFAAGHMRPGWRQARQAAEQPGCCSKGTGRHAAGHEGTGETQQSPCCWSFDGRHSSILVVMDMASVKHQAGFPTWFPDGV